MTLQFVLGQQLGADFIDLGFLGDGLRRRRSVAGEHDHFFHAEAVELVRELAGGGADGVRHDEHGSRGDGIALADA